MTNRKYNMLAMPFMPSLKWLTVSDIIKSETATIMYKSLNNLVPEYLSNVFLNNSTRNMRNLRSTETYDAFTKNF